MHFVFVHGWGFNPAIWRDIVAHIEGADVRSSTSASSPADLKACGNTWPRTRSLSAIHSGLGCFTGQGRAAALPRPGQHPGLRPLLPHIPPSRVAAACGAGFAAIQRRPCRPSGAAAALRLCASRGPQCRAARRGPWLADGVGCERGEGRARLPDSRPCRPRRRHRAGRP